MGIKHVIFALLSLSAVLSTQNKQDKETVLVLMRHCNFIHFIYIYIYIILE